MDREEIIGILHQCNFKQK